MKPFDENYDIDDFISGVDLLKKWKIDKFALFHYIRKDQEKLLPKPLTDPPIDCLPLKVLHPDYIFQPWNPVTLRPVIIRSSRGIESCITLVCFHRQI